MPDLSAQQVMSCNYLNEGCNGGWSIFHGNFYENAALVEESCAQYTGEAGGCANLSGCKGVARVSRSYFLSDMSEQGIQREILMNGMVDANIDSPLGHTTFSEGVLGKSYSNGAPLDVPNHVIAILGWGEENGVKYWLTRSAYGTTFGSSGDIKIERGINLFLIE